MKNKMHVLKSYSFLLYDVVVCDPPCENGACIGNNTCNCAAGFSGERCNEIGMLSLNHHAHCYQLTYHQHIYLAVITECDINPCENGGTCQIRAGSYSCICPLENTGLLCSGEFSMLNTVLFQCWSIRRLALWIQYDCHHH